jgi:hypothetical protein
MTALTASFRTLCCFALSLSACEVYGPELVQLPVQGGSGGATGATAGDGGNSVIPGGASGAVSGGTAGETTAGSAGEGSQPPDPPETVPYLTVAISAPVITVTLSSEGALDWAHWGLGSASDRNQKEGVTSLLLDFTPTGSKQPTRFLDGPTTFSWSDGMPTAMASTNDGIAWQGVDEGFEIVVPAVEAVRKLRLYVGVFNGTGAMKASLSDPRANSIGDDRFSSPTAAWVLQVITIDYGNATLPDTTMTVSWSLESGQAANAAVALTAISVGNG